MVRRFLIFALSFWLASWVGGYFCLAQAISFAGLGIRPAYPEPSQPRTRSWFIYQLASGESKDDAVVVSNNSSRRIKAKLYAVDATTTKDGVFALLGEKDSQQGIGAWVKLAVGEISLAAGEEKIVPFKITLPATIKAGDYLGGVMVEDLAVSRDKGINMVTRVGVRIYETVPGELVNNRTLKFAYLSQGAKRVMIAFFVFSILALVCLLYSRRRGQRVF